MIVTGRHHRRIDRTRLDHVGLGNVGLGNVGPGDVGFDHVGLDRLDAGLLGLGLGRRSAIALVGNRLGPSPAILRGSRPLLGFLVLARLLLLRFEEPLPIRDRDLVVIRMDLAESEEPVPVAAILDERGLQARFDADDFGEVNVAF